jgi:Flp pilus assembly secretin CpaC
VKRPDVPVARRAGPWHPHPKGTVAIDTGNLQEKIRSVTGSRGIRVRSSNGQIVLSGVAGNAVATERAVAVASGQDRRR